LCCHTVDDVLAARERREPDDLGADPQRGFDRGWVHAADLVVAADAPEYGDVGHVALHRPRQRGGGKVVGLQDDRAVTGRRGFARGIERVNGAGAVRVGAEVAVQVGCSGEVDGHG
jgi:hypothetical protein